MAYSSITKPSDYFNTITYTGNDTDGRTITGVGFQSDWTWVKARSSAFSHYLIDAIRYDSGSSKYLKLDSSSSAADETPSAAGWISTLNADGYVCKNGTSNTNNSNENGVTYVAWNWLAANGTASNSDGSITSTVSANTTAGFSIVSYSGNGTDDATVGHGLSQKPDMVIIKARENTSSWATWHKNLTGSNYLLFLDASDAQSQYTTILKNQSSSVLTLGTNSASNANGQGFISYNFHSVKGYSKFGSFTGNGNADGTFVYTGMKPSFVLLKETSNANNWMLFDDKRSPFNLMDDFISPDITDAESTGNSNNRMDMLSNGFKIRGSGSATNRSGSNFIYMAFSENPFVGNDSGTAVPVTAR